MTLCTLTTILSIFRLMSSRLAGQQLDSSSNSNSSKYSETVSRAVCDCGQPWVDDGCDLLKFNSPSSISICYSMEREKKHCIYRSTWERHRAACTLYQTMPKIAFRKRNKDYNYDTSSSITALHSVDELLYGHITNNNCN